MEPKLSLNEYFIKALQAEAWRWRHWIFSAMAVARLENDDYKVKPFPYKLTVKDGNYFYIDPENGDELSFLAPYSPTEPLFRYDREFEIKAGDLINLSVDCVTTYGNALFNASALVYPFGSIVPYYNDVADPGKIESLFIDKVISDPKDGVVPEGKITVTMAQTHVDVMYNVIGNLSRICVQSTSPRMLKPDQEIIALRDRLLEENKDKLDDIVVVAGIIKQLVDALKASFKDDPAKDFLYKGKHFDTILFRTQVMHGVEHSFMGDGTFELITKSLSEGWDLDRFAELNNSSRMGSYNRGANTAMGGEAVKFFYRRFQNSRLFAKDCGSTVTIPKVITKFNFQRVIGNSFVDGSGQLIEITVDNVKGLIGTKVQIRDPSGCKAGKIDYCACCLGKNYLRTPRAIANIMAEVPSQWMNLYMKKMHGESLRTIRFDFRRHFS